MSEDNIVRAIPIHEGVKILMTDEKSFLDVDNFLNENGFTTRCNEEQ